MIASSKKKIILYEMLMEQINLYIMGVDISVLDIV